MIKLLLASSLYLLTNVNGGGSMSMTRLRLMWQAWGKQQVEFADPEARRVMEARLPSLTLDTIRAVKVMPSSARQPVDYLFNNNVDLKSFEEMKYFTSLEKTFRTFYGCKQLAGVITVPASVREVGSTTFFDTQLVGIEFLAQNFKWGHGAIWRCTKLKWIKMHSKEVPQKITANDKWVFDFAITNLTWKLYVPDISVEKYRADYNFQNLGDRIRPMSEFKY